MHVVGDAHHLDAGERQRLAGFGIGEEALIAHRMPGGCLVEAAFEIAEHHVGVAKFVRHLRERYGGGGGAYSGYVARADHVYWGLCFPLLSVLGTLFCFSADLLSAKVGLFLSPLLSRALIGECRE